MSDESTPALEVRGLTKVFGTRISVRAEQMTYLVGFVFLFAFIIWVTGFDLARAFGGVAPVTP